MKFASQTLWWVMMKNEPYRYKLEQGEIDKTKPVLVNNLLIVPATGEVLKNFIEVDNRIE